MSMTRVCCRNHPYYRPLIDLLGLQLELGNITQMVEDSAKMAQRRIEDITKYYKGQGI
jgi:hypothetical protein